MRIRILALVPDAFGSLGGMSKFNRDLLTAFCLNSDCAELVAVPRVAPDSVGPLPPKLTWAPGGLGGKWFYLGAVVRCALGFVPQSRSTARFDLVICGHINLLPAAFLARCLAGLFRRPAPRIALFIHGLEAWQPHPSRLVRRLVQRVDRVISVSRFTLERFVQWSGLPAERGDVLPNCVDLAGFAPGEKDASLLQKYGLAGKRVLLTVGRLVENRPKGIEEVLESLPFLAQTMPDLAYLIVGDGPARARLEAMAHGLGIDDRVIFAGRIPETEKADHYRLADAFVMPGYGEGFGIVYLEALACGLPVLGSSLDASREALGDGKLGVLVNPRDSAALRRSLIQVLQSPRGVPPELEEFSFPQFVRRCQALLKALPLPSR